MRTLLLFGFMSLAASARASIDFTPTVTPYISEGAEYATATFKDEKRVISLSVPRQWTCHGDASRLQLTPPNQKFAEGVIQSVSAKEPVRFDEAAVASLAQQAIATLPIGSQGATLVSQQENPVIIGGNLSYEFVVSYQTLGQTFQRSVIIVSCPAQALIFRFTAPKHEFEALNRAFRQSLCSWTWIDPAPTATLAQKDHAAAISGGN
jgi:hypothetical protein